MLFVALVINPILVGLTIRGNPYPLVFKCLKESGITAFFTRSSAANIPVNLDLAERLGVNPSTASVSIPLGATVNMAGAAVTITVLTLATVHTLGIHVDLATMIILSIVATISACGASGVAGGSLLLIPVACSLFGISSEIAMQVVAVGMIISVLQDSQKRRLTHLPMFYLQPQLIFAQDKTHREHAISKFTKLVPTWRLLTGNKCRND